jgi:Protein of unknown function (DUF3987)
MIAPETSVNALAEAFPPELLKMRQWLLWRFVVKPDQKKPSKVPYYATTGELRGWPMGKPKDGTPTDTQPQVEQGHPLDREHLVSFDEAFEAMQDLGFDGIGFAFLPGDGLIGIDLDVYDDPAKKARADAIIREVGSWAETSPSGTGVHIICRGEVETFKHNGIGIEVFCGRQFFTMTGRHIEGTPAQLHAISPDVLTKLQRTVQKAKDADREAKAASRGEQPHQPAAQAPMQTLQYSTAAEQERVRLYCMTALQDAVATVSRMSEGGRNESLNSETYGLASLLYTGMLHESTIRSAMEGAGITCGLPIGEVRATVNSAIAGALRNNARKAIPEPTYKGKAKAASQQAQQMPPHDPETGEVLGAPEPANDNAPLVAAWSDPIDLFGVSMPPELTIGMLPDAIQEYVHDQAERMGCDPGVIGISSIVAAAACIHDSIQLQPLRHDYEWTESARLWAVVVGDPSTRKTPAISKAVRVARRIDMRMAEENASEMADYIHQHEQWKDAKKSKNSEPIPEPKKPAAKRLVVDDTTIEALSEVLKDNSRGVLTIKDELTGWFAAMDAYKGGGKGASMDRSKWLEAYNGGRQIIDRVQRGNIIVPNWSTCIVGGIQPDMMRKVSSSMGNDGLLQRFMVLVARPAGATVDRVPDRPSIDRYNSLFDHLVSIQPSSNRVHLTEQAHVVRERIEARSNRMVSAFDHPHIQAWLGKWTGLFARLLLTYHVIECASMGKYPAEVKVSGETAEKVERLMCDVLLHHAIHFYTEVIDAHERQENVRQLARTILAKGFQRITKRDLTLHWKTSRRLEGWEMRATIEALCNMAWLEPEESSTDPMDGKPRAWRVNPKVHEVFARQAEREAQRRREAMEVIREIRGATAAGKSL